MFTEVMASTGCVRARYTARPVQKWISPDSCCRGANMQTEDRASCQRDDFVKTCGTFRVLVGVTGSVAALKLPLLVSQLLQISGVSFFLSVFFLISNRNQLLSVVSFVCLSYLCTKSSAKERSEALKMSYPVVRKHVSPWQRSQIPSQSYRAIPRQVELFGKR